jgi:hypothetical protein
MRIPVLRIVLYKGRFSRKFQVCEIIPSNAEIKIPIRKIFHYKFLFMREFSLSIIKGF